MTIIEYIENLNRLKQLAIDNWGQLTEVERQIFDSSFDWLVDNLELKKGEIKVDEDLPAAMDRFLSAVVKIVNENKGYESIVTSFLADLKTIQRNNKDFHATAFNFDIETAGVKEAQKTVVNEILNQYLDNGLNQHFAAPLRDNIFRNILAGANMKQVREVLRNYILSGQDQSGKLGRYLHNTAIMAVDSYTGKINQQLMVEFDFTGMIISGSLIETSSTQCIYAVDNSDRGYFSMNDWETVLQIARDNKRARLIEGTTVKNLPLNKLHWGCRHDFTPVIKKAIEKDLPKVKEEPKPEPKPEVKPRETATPAIGAATTINQGRQQIVDLFAKNIGLKINGTPAISSSYTVEKLNQVIKKLDELTREYHLSTQRAETSNPTIKFKSTKSAYGVIHSTRNGEQVVKMNFGDQSEVNSRSIEYTDKTIFLLGKSRVDKDNAPIATVVHEFGHVIGVHNQGRYGKFPEEKKFWDELFALSHEYVFEIKKFRNENNDQGLVEISLGKYALKNLNEFMAEGFTEYKLRKNPSKYAKKIGLLIDKYFKK